jgi:hypothetical protein
VVEVGTRGEGEGKQERSYLRPATELLAGLRPDTAMIGSADRPDRADALTHARRIRDHPFTEAT